MNKDTRLHPLFILFSLADTAKKLWPVLLIFLFKGAQNPNRILIIGGGVLFLFLMADVIKWRRFTYRMEEDKLIIRHGLFMRDEKTIYFSRIHSVRVEQPLLQRLFGMAQLKIETPGGSAEADGVLSALTREAADQLRSMLMRQGKGEEPSGEAGDAEVEAREPREAGAAPLPGHAVRMTTGQLFVAALSTMNFGLVLAFFAGIISFADDIAKFIIPQSVFDKLLQFYETSVSGPMSILITVVGALLLSWLLSTVLYIVKYYGFTAEQRDGDILITNGLFEKKMNIFKPERVQAIIVKEGLLRQALGYAEIEVRVLSADKKEALMLHPYVPVRQIPELLSRIIPGFDIGSVQHCAPRRAWWYYFRFRLLFLALAFLGLYWFQGPLAYWLLLLLPVLLLTGYLSFHDEGVGLQDRQLIVRNRIIARKTCYVLRPQIVALKLGHTYFQERKQLLSLTAHLLNGDSYSLTSLEERDLQEVWHWYRKKKR